MATITEQTNKQHMLPVILASTLGTTIEWYDFFLYGTAAVLVFPKVFFPMVDPFLATMLALSTFLVGFIARPFGGIIFGHLGDRIGRKSTLIATLLVMGTATFIIGFIPAYGVIGIFAPLLVVIMRVCQGIGVGGEWGGSVLIALEHSPERNRGFWTSWPQVGAPLGLVLAAGALAAFSSISGNQFLNWGWRIPFILSAFLIIIGLFIRLRIPETPLFAKVLEEKQEAKLPVVDVISRNWKEILLTAGARFVEQAPFYLFSAFILIYGVDSLHLDKGFLLTGIYIAALIEVCTIPLFSALSDRFGRKRWYLLGCVLMLLFAFPYFLLLSSGNPALIILSIILSLAFFHSFVYGPQAALISEHFSTKLRYSGASLGYQLAAPFAGGLAPLIALALLHNYGSYVPIAIFIIILAVISFVAVLGLKELSQADISQ